MNILGFLVTVAVCIFAVVEVVGLVRDIKSKKAKKQQLSEQEKTDDCTSSYDKHSREN